MEKVSFEQIEQFLEGSDPQQYIIGIESSYSENLVYLIINDPETGKRIEPHKFKPFVWVKEEVVKRLYGGNSRKIQEVAKKYNISFKKLRTLTEDGDEPERMANGYKYLVTITGHGYSKLQEFFRNGGVDARHEDDKKLFTSFFRASNIRNLPGTGLGLVVVKYFLDLHKGYIDVASKLNEGSSFIISIPTTL